MFTLKMKLSGTMRGIPVPTGEITRCFNTSTTMLEYLAGVPGWTAGQPEVRHHR